MDDPLPPKRWTLRFDLVARQDAGRSRRIKRCAAMSMK
jgi:hypothetical protein